ncbi:CHAT domain-containing protein [Pseudonocardia nigra]|uniref:CHAT domain-containing protein n=1 Tax=Pseudonocardia nigra TaxID=1921578 RepID=UPI001C5EEFEC|nr:CHAT domain-containing protein [Pseudonocardia nigra]
MTTEPSPVDELLARPTPAERLAFLRSAGRDDAAGLTALLDVAAELAGGDPKRGYLLAQTCAAAATGPGQEGLLARACYTQAQAGARNGRLDEALELIETARRIWTESGNAPAALRTGLGRMHVLNERGEHDAAATTGTAMLVALEGPDGDGDRWSPSDRLELRGMIHQNLGMTHGFAGRWQDLIVSSREAATQFAAAGITDRAAALHENIGIAMMQLGRVGEAIAEFELAVAGNREQGHVLGHGRSLIELGRARLLLGEFRVALATFDEAGELLARLGPLPDQDWLAVSRGDAYLVLNLHDEALASYLPAERAFRAAGLTYDIALTLSSRGAALVRAERLDEAAAVLGEALELWEGAGNVPMLASTLLELAALRARAGGGAEAAKLVRRALVALDGGDWPVEAFYARLLLADLALPDLDEAERRLEQAREPAARLAIPHLDFRLDERLGRVRLGQGRPDEARMLLERAVATVESLRGGLPRESMRTAFLRDKTAAYAALVEMWLDRGDPESLRRAFEMAERAKSRSLVDLMLGSVTARIATGEADPRVQRLLALQADLDAVYDALLGDDPDGVRGPRAAQLRGRAAELEREIGMVRLDVPVQERRAAPAALPALRRTVPGDVVVLAYHVLDDEVTAFVRRGDRLAAVRRVTTLARLRPLLARLAAQWSRFHAGPTFAGRHADRLTATTRRVLADLHDALVTPLGDLLPAGGRLAVVPHGILHRVPFHALFDGERYLLERFAISYAPSVTALGVLRPPALRHRALVLGVPAPDIPNVSAEVATVADALPGARLGLGEEATRAALRSGAPGCGIVHIACHGLFRPENPMFSALRLHDGWLTAADVLDLDLDRALVVLSACESGANRVVGGGDEVMGLPRAFLGAGAAAVVVSLWLVQDDTTEALMRHWYAGLRSGQDGATALRAAQLALRADRPHPYHWAPFVFIGSPPAIPEEDPQ